LNHNHHIALVTHSEAGVGRALILTEQICRWLEARHISYHVFRNVWPGDFEGFTSVWIVGGDGTLNQFVNRYPDIGIPLGIFNGGTGNDFHWLLYGETTPEAQLDAMLLARPVPIDLGTFNDRFFINGIGIGFEGEVARSLTGKRKRPGKTSFMFAVLRNIFSYRSEYYHIRYEGYDKIEPFLLLDLNNGSRAGGGFHVAPAARPDDGMLDLITAAPLNAWQRLRYLPVIERGRHMSLPFVTHRRVNKIIIESNTIMRFHCDGEFGEAQKLEIGVIPGHLKFLCPESSSSVR
jgi:YegS/Rv2252/BmrU family lipid kinase